MWELHGSALFSFLFSPKFFSQLLLKACLHLFDYMELLSWSPRQIKSKEFKWSEELERGWKRSVLAFILHQNTLSLPGHNYSPDLFWTTLTESQMNTPSSLVWTCITFAVDQEQKLFAKLFRSTECYYFPSPTFHVSLFLERLTFSSFLPDLLQSRKTLRLLLFYGDIQGNPPTFEWLRLKLLMRCFYI